MGPAADTIAAISTPPIPAAIGILRLSGPRAAQIAAVCFKPLGRKGLLEHRPHELVYGDLLDTEGAVIDRVLCTFSLAPHSYTGEDTAEIHCHGAPMVLQLGLEALFAAGARQAQRGEFTRRAFLNGKLDLAQAEAVGDLLEADSRQAARNAAGQLNGALSRRIGAVYSALLDVMAHFHAVLDYPDEDIDPFTARQLGESLAAQRTALEQLAASWHRGQLVKNGVPCAIVGRPNAGKSSLLNALVGYDRAIVTDVAGTTRDTVEEKVRVGHVLLRLCDTAGIHQTEDAVEKIGVERARAAARQASLALLVLDGSTPLTDADREAMDLARQAPNLLVAVNKSDLPRAVDIGRLADEFDNVVSLSARSGEGVSVLCDAIGAMYPAGEGRPGELLTNARQADAVSRALASVRSARSALRIGMTPDVVLTDAEAALEALGELNGKHIRDDLIQTIFSRFCVGK